MSTLKDDLLAYAEKIYGAEPEYLWRRYPAYAVLRHKDNSKWFALVMDVPATKLGLTGEEWKDILNVTDLNYTQDGVPLLKNVSFLVTRGQKIALVGNEQAATALFRILAEEIQPDSGTVKWGVTISTSYFPKDNSPFFDGCRLAFNFCPEKDRNGIAAEICAATGQAPLFMEWSPDPDAVPESSSPYAELLGVGRERKKKGRAWPFGRRKDG